MIAILDSLAHPTERCNEILNKRQLDDILKDKSQYLHSASNRKITLRPFYQGNFGLFSISTI